MRYGRGAIWTQTAGVAASLLATPLQSVAADRQQTGMQLCTADSPAVQVRSGRACEQAA
jgi:hypothetical protein